MACPEVFVVNNPCSCYIDTCSKKLQSEIIIQIKHDVAPRHIQKLETSVCESWRRLLTKEKLARASRLNCLAVFFSFSKKANCERRSLGC